MANLVRGFETRTVAALAAELVARAQSAMEIGAIKIQITLAQSANKHTDTGEMRDSVSVEVFGGLSGFGARQVGMIASATAPQAEWVDKGTSSPIMPVSSSFLNVGARAPNRRHAPTQHKGHIYRMRSVNGQPATNWFSAPFGRPLSELMREAYHGAFRRLR